MVRPKKMDHSLLKRMVIMYFDVRGVMKEGHDAVSDILLRIGDDPDDLGDAVPITQVHSLFDCLVRFYFDTGKLGKIGQSPESSLQRRQLLLYLLVELLRLDGVKPALEKDQHSIMLGAYDQLKHEPRLFLLL